MAITRVIYIVYPTKATMWFASQSTCILLCSIPVCLALCYAIPTLFPCCHRLYAFSTFAFSYVGPRRDVQMKFSLFGTVIAVSTLMICYTWVVVFLWQRKRTVRANRKSYQSIRQNDTAKELRKASGDSGAGSQNIEIKV